MRYIIKKKEQQIPIEKTFTEIEESQYSCMSQINLGKKGVVFLTVAFFSMLLFASFSHAFEIKEIHAEDGAGTYWTCSYCGQSNKCYEIWCSNCGR